MTWAFYCRKICRNYPKLNIIKKKTLYPPHYLLDKCVKGRVVNRAVQSFHWVSLKLTLTVPLNTEYIYVITKYKLVCRKNLILIKSHFTNIKFKRYFILHFTEKDVFWNFLIIFLDSKSDLDFLTSFYSLVKLIQILGKV